MNHPVSLLQMFLPRLCSSTLARSAARSAPPRGSPCPHPASRTAARIATSPWESRPPACSRKCVLEVLQEVTRPPSPSVQVLMTVAIKFVEAGKFSLLRKCFDMALSFAFQILYFGVSIQVDKNTLGLCFVDIKSSVAHIQFMGTLKNHLLCNWNPN